MANELHLQTMVTINAPKDQRRAGSGKKQIEPPPRRAGLGDGDAVHVGALRAKALGTLVQGPAFFSRYYFFLPLVKKKFEQRHSDRNAVRRLFEIDSPAVFVDLGGKLIHPRQGVH